MTDSSFTYTRYVEGDTDIDWADDQAIRGDSPICPTYEHRTPPCQGGCPSGHDVRGWLSIVRGLDKPPEGMPWEEYAFRRMTKANPFPAVMGRVCPAPCQEGCNRIAIEDFVGINSIEQYIGDWALEHGLGFSPPEQESGKHVAIVGAGPAGLAAAYFLRQRGHGCTIFDEYSEAGGMMVFGIPGYRIPRQVLSGEIQRILEIGVDLKLNTRVGRDISLDDIDAKFDAVFWGVGAVTGKMLPIPGFSAPNCVDGISFLRAFNEHRLKYLSGRILVIGGGDTAMDVVAVARRIGQSARADDEPTVEEVINTGTTHHENASDRRSEGDVWIVYRRPISKAPATKHELQSVIEEGVEIHEGLAPLEVMLDDQGRARALKVMPVDWVDGKMVERKGEEFEIECSLIVSATGQKGDYEGLEPLDNGWGQMESDKLLQVPDRKGHFVGGDALNPHLLTTAIGHASVAVRGIDLYLKGEEIPNRPKVDVHHFSLLNELSEQGSAPEPYHPGEIWGTDTAAFAVHNYENRSFAEIVTHEELYLGHFEQTQRLKRGESQVNAGNVLGHFDERFSGLSEEHAIAEANRCMSCGMCFECDSCVVYCPQDAVSRARNKKQIIGRYVVTDYSKCIGCRICADVCPSGYIQMGMGG